MLSATFFFLKTAMQLFFLKPVKAKMYFLISYII